MIVAISDRYELPRWALSAALIVAIHAGLAFMLTHWHEPVEGNEGTDAIVVDLAPFTSQPSETQDNLAPGALQEQSDSTPQIERPKEEQKPEEKPPPPIEPAQSSDVSAPSSTVTAASRPASEDVELLPAVTETAAAPSPTGPPEIDDDSPPPAD